MIKKWDNFLLPYEQAVSEIKAKFLAVRHQFELSQRHVPIEFVVGRVKPIDSILEKMQRRKISYERLASDMEDIAGVRIMCQFVDDIYQIVKLIRKREDMYVIDERDYILNKKPSGYRSYHIVVEYPVQMLEGEKRVLVEIQIRTLAMNFWATIEHSLNYKYQGEFPEELADRLQRAAEAAFQLDKEMTAIREEIQEAQSLFSYKRGHKEQ
ncbi:GTP pyrophosphokinase [Liquorilactobacillus sucicola DSM 21376 = JCM 15457]|uniref:GTP pyrophosphokinase n=1 Tax=Liquorilactobacillus sucicola DSM 21376 = JCM 15457 TaxID=1423806 RepID=A0A023CWG5_9LACO|nr:GTP pyrophosphokinase family protein [Liquorilactobacillus sucicola]KRN06016.1 GTP pyrophosphokinase [Liquorilactobacillus sucicola DSM 21376 = JCM 15457]GAJ25941.1 GTP pyrophosphokinase [Liquorilactobacillus sucicola DSM 21376 = JCM 15457]